LDTIPKIRQMMAEQKLSDALKQIESLLKTDKSAKHDLLLMYYEISMSLERQMPFEYLLELAKTEIEKKNYSFVAKLLNNDVLRQSSEVDELRIIILDEHGKLHKLYQEISRILISRLENQNPSLPNWLSLRVEKFFKNDFSLKLMMLTRLLQLNDLDEAETLIKKLILDCFEKPNARGGIENLKSLFEILKSSQTKSYLEIYQNFCQIYLYQITEKKDYKRLIEMVIYFDEFKFQVLLLDLLVKLQLSQEAALYTETLKLNKEYSFLYLEKYFKHLKKFFKSKLVDVSKIKDELPDLAHDSFKPIKITNDDLMEIIDCHDPTEDNLAAHIVKYQEFSFGQLCDLSVGFLQAEVPRVALVAAEKALSLVQANDQFLKANYLKMMCLLMIKDYRAVIDVAYEALDRVERQEDRLSFLYAQAEAFLKLKKGQDAKKVLTKIIGIDETYRLAKTRLMKLNEI
jgi:hypothetical protein